MVTFVRNRQLFASAKALSSFESKSAPLEQIAHEANVQNSTVLALRFRAQFKEPVVSTARRGPCHACSPCFLFHSEEDLVAHRLQPVFRGSFGNGRRPREAFSRGTPSCERNPDVSHHDASRPAS